MAERYRATPSKTDPTSWNVIDTTRLSTWGEGLVVIPLITKEHAEAEAQRLNAAAAKA